MSEPNVNATQAPEVYRLVRRPIPMPDLTEADLDRFFSKVDLTPGHGPHGRCHRWLGALSEPGYGTFKVAGKMLRAHRVAFFIEYEADPMELLVCHSCDRKWCVNPEHYFISDTEGNTFDAMLKGRMPSGERNGNYKPPERHINRIKSVAETKILSQDEVAALAGPKPLKKKFKPASTKVSASKCVPLPPIYSWDVDRFWDFVDKNGPIPKDHPELGQCWIWTGAKTKRGYGVFQVRYTTTRANRVGYYIKFNEDPYPLEVLHDCDNASCVRHLSKGTRQQNMADAAKRKRMHSGDENISRKRPELLARGEAHPNVTLPDTTICAIRIEYRDDPTATATSLGKKYSMDNGNIGRILKGQLRLEAGGPIVDRLRTIKGTRRRFTTDPTLAISIKRDILSLTMTDKTISRKYGITNNLVARVRRGDTWGWVNVE